MKAAVALFVAAVLVLAGPIGSQATPYYGGGKHSNSHGGEYRGGQGTRTRAVTTRTHQGATSTASTNSRQGGPTWQTLTSPW